MVMTESKPVQQAFGSPGGKSRLASRIVEMMPEHRIYVEPFAGGAAVYFKKGASAQEVLNDKDAEIAFAFKFLANMTPEQYTRLKKKNWKITRKQFNRVKSMPLVNDVDRFYKFYYLKKGSFGRGSETVNVGAMGSNIGIARLSQLQERLKNTRVHTTTALKMIEKYDSPNTLFYLDPPYPGRKLGLAGKSAFNQYTTDDLNKLVTKLKHIRGKFILSLGTEHQKYLPEQWQVQRLKLRRNIPQGGAEWNKSFQYEIIATNYNPDRVKPFKGFTLQEQMAIHRKNGQKPKRHKRSYASPVPMLVGVRR